MKLLRIDMTNKHFKIKGKAPKGIDKHVIAQLKGIEKSLPPIAVEAYESTATAPDSSYRVRGEQLLEANPEARDKHGSPINKDAMYDLPIKHKHTVNHFKRLKSAYQRGGWDAVDKYIGSVKKLVVMSDITEQPQNGPAEEK